MSIDDILLEAEEKMSKTEEVVVKEFAGVRTGKASPGLIENVQVDVYGSTMRIRELAGITTPESRVLLVQPWDASTVHAIATLSELAMPNTGTSTHTSAAFNA